MKPILTLGWLLAVLPRLNFAAPAVTTYERDCATLAAAKTTDAERLHQLFQLDWDRSLIESPEFATEVGVPGQDHRWSDISLPAIARRKRELQAPLKVLRAINRAQLNATDQLSYDLFRNNQEQAVEGTRFPTEYFQITQLNGIPQDIARLLAIAPHATIPDYEHLIARLNGVPGLVDQTLVLLKQGLTAGITPPRVTLRDVPQQVKNQMETDPQRNSLLDSFRKFPAEIPEAQQMRLRREAELALTEKVIPAFGKLHEFLVRDYLPGARETIAMSDLPDGKAWYEFSARVSTTTRLPPQQIHELGLAEVKRIRSEMDKVIAATGFKGNFGELLEFLRTDPRFAYTNAEDLLRGYRDICKRADPELARLFGKLPRLPYGVLPIPDYAAKSQTTGYYQPGAPSAGRPGYFYANTYAVETRFKWEMEALTLHEAVPGHHLQIALAQEMDAVPEFRKQGSYTAFVEGWGLYAESLGSEMGFYQDPYARFGQLVYEMWRAIRLVVDTGMHAKGWTRQQAIDYFLANASKNAHDVTVEVDRYLVWPGQALAYKIGELRIKELRAYAAQELGDRFDIRQFHDQILGQAAVPLDLLAAHLKEWVTARKTGKSQ
ncbi:MAG: DUF885 domain-containing protein [Verrucomicrobia subdivision 3 bacterium]|nr:DUF885 domain-containing protein [Limisphaerales bacterium]